MSTHQTYQEYLKSKGKTENEVSNILDPTEWQSILALVMMSKGNQDLPGDVHKLFSTSDFENIAASTNEILVQLNQGLVAKYSIGSSVFVGVYPTNFFDGTTDTFKGERLILVNEGALQLIGGTVQLFYSQLGPFRKVQELIEMINNYTQSSELPENSAFSGSWANFDFEQYQKTGEMVTTAETFLILHEYGHVELQITEHGEEEELKADRWALQQIKNKLRMSDLFCVGPFIVLGICYLIEEFSKKNDKLLAKTHPGALLRLAQAASEFAPYIRGEETEIITKFLNLIDSTLSSYSLSKSAITSKIFKVANSLAIIFPANLFDNLSIDIPATIKLQAMIEVAKQEFEEGFQKKTEISEPKGLPPGLQASDEEGVFLYELPTGEKVEMVFVEKGSFLQGPRVLPGFPSVGDLDGAANKAILVDTKHAFYIGRYPILWFQFDSFCRALNRDFPNRPSWEYEPDKPVVNVTVADVEAFCQWAGLQLPSEIEWEKAARGTDGRLFPWGELPPNQPLDRRSSPESTAPNSKTASPYGAENMVGGVWEITSDWLESDSPMNAGQYRVVRGASYRADPQAATVLSRHRVMPNFPREDIGFRVVLRVEKPVSNDSIAGDWITEVLAPTKARTNAIPFQDLSNAEKGAARLLFQACEDSVLVESFETVQRIVMEYPDSVFWTDEEGFTPLLRIKHHTFEIPFRIASFLIDHGADVNAYTPRVGTILHLLAMMPMGYSLELASLILQHGGDVTIKNDRGETPEMVAKRFKLLGAPDGFLALINSMK